MIKKGIRPQLAEVGKIKTGFKGAETMSKNKKKFRPPKKVDFFFITTTERGDDGNLVKNRDLMEKIAEAQGVTDITSNGTPRLKELRIRLPFDSVDKNFFTQYQAYDGGKKVCAGDGENAERRGEVTVNDKGYLNRRGDDLRQVQCDPETCPIYGAGKCKVSGILSVFLPDADDLGGVFKYRTHSYNAVASILGALEYFKANTGGILQGLPLKLVMVKKTTVDHGTFNYPTIVIDGVEIRGLRQLAVEETQSRKLLGTDVETIERQAEAAGFFKDTDPEAVVDAEFYHDEENGAPEAASEDIKEALAEDGPADDTEGVGVVGDEEVPQDELF